MRRPLLVLAAVMILGGAAQQATTASNSLPADTTANYRSVTVNGARAMSMQYSVLGGSITGLTTRLRGTNLPLTATARFGSAPTVTCTRSLLSVLNILTGLGEATYTCIGFGEAAAKPRPLVITA